MNEGFSNVAPYLKDPLVLIGFFLFLAFLLTRYMLSLRIIPPLPAGPGFKILKTVLLYGFIIGLLLIVLGFIFKYRELVGQEQQAAQERELKRRTQEAAERQAEKDRDERENLRRREENDKIVAQINTVRLLREELISNLKSINEMRKNTEVSLNSMLAVAKTLRTPGIKILPVLFPAENLNPAFEGTPELAAKVMDALGESGLTKDQVELRKFSLAGQLMTSTVEKTLPTIKSLGDETQVRYPIRKQVWTQYLPSFRNLTVVDITEFQRCYADMESARTNYDIIQARIVDYLISVRDFFRPANNQIARDAPGRVLTSEHLALALAATYGDQLVANITSIKKLTDRLLSFDRDSRASAP